MTITESATRARATDRPAPTTMRPHLLLAVVLLSTLTLITAAWGIDGGVIPLLFWLLVPGLIARRLLRGRPQIVADTATVVAISAAVLMLLASVNLWLGGWEPRAITAVVAALATATGLLALWRARGEVTWALRPARDGNDERPSWRPCAEDYALVAVALSALLAWVVALPSIDPADATVGGLLVGASPLLAISLAVATTGFLASVRLHSWPGAVAAFVVGLLALRVTTPLVSAEPMFDWTYKHLGVIEFIQSFGDLSRPTDIYHSWPGFFAATAWLSDISGIGATSLALWFTPLITLLTCLAIASLARRVVGGSPWVGIVAAWIFLMLNWIGQDYFSPQAVGLLLGVVVLRLALEEDRRAHLLALLPFAGIVVSHQLTPYWVVAIVWAFALTRRVHWWLPLALSVLAVGYFLINLDSLSNYGLFTGFNPVANAQTSGGGFSSDAKLFADWAARIAMVVMWLATLLVLWRRRRGGRDWLVPAIVSFGPFIFLLAQSYGGEGLLRVALYSLVGCSAVLAPTLIGALRAPRLAPAVATGTVAFLVGACAAQAYFGAWYTHQMPSAEVRVSSALQQQVPRPAYIAPLLPSWPSRNEAEYVDWVDRAGRDYDYAAFSVRQSGATYADPAELAALEAILRERAPWPSFLVISDRMETVNRYRTFLAPEAFANLRTKLPRRAGWSTVMTDGDVTVLRYVPAAARQEAASCWSAPS